VLGDLSSKKIGTHGLLPETLRQHFCISERENSFDTSRSSGQRNVGVVNLHKVAETLGMSLSELFAEAEEKKRRNGG